MTWPAAALAYAIENADRITGWALALIGLALCVRVLIVMSRERNADQERNRGGLESRVRFLEEQVLHFSQTESMCISLNAAAIALLSSAASGGDRTAVDADIQRLRASSDKLNELIEDRHEMLKLRFQEKASAVRTEDRT